MLCAMPDTWVTKLEHYLDDDGEFPVDLPGPARSLATFFARVVASVTGEGEGSVPCRRRPGRKPCGGEILGVLDTERSEIDWHCTECGDNGVLSGWAGTKWDRRRETLR